jgi:hydroxylaminobenzene mutase
MDGLGAAQGHRLRRQGQRLLQLGIALILFTSLEGFIVPNLRSPKLGLSAHTLTALIAVLMLAVGLLWPRLQLSAAQANIAFWLFIYSSLAIIAAYLLAGAWGAGNTVMPLAAGPAHGTPAQEAVIMIVAYSSAPTGFVSFAMTLWGLRASATD